MNKSQELDIMVVRAKKNAEEAIKNHLLAWYGEDTEEQEE